MGIFISKKPIVISLALHIGIAALIVDFETDFKVKKPKLEVLQTVELIFDQTKATQSLISSQHFADASQQPKLNATSEKLATLSPSTQQKKKKSTVVAEPTAAIKSEVKAAPEIENTQSKISENKNLLAVSATSAEQQNLTNSKIQKPQDFVAPPSTKISEVTLSGSPTKDEGLTRDTKKASSDAEPKLFSIPAMPKVQPKRSNIDITQQTEIMVSSRDVMGKDYGLSEKKSKPQNSAEQTLTKHSHKTLAGVSPEFRALVKTGQKLSPGSRSTPLATPAMPKARPKSANIDITQQTKIMDFNSNQTDKDVGLSKKEKNMTSKPFSGANILLATRVPADTKKGVGIIIAKPSEIGDSANREKPVQASFVYGRSHDLKINKPEKKQLYSTPNISNGRSCERLTRVQNQPANKLVQLQQWHNSRHSTIQQLLGHRAASEKHVSNLSVSDLLLRYSNSPTKNFSRDAVNIEGLLAQTNIRNMPAQLLCVTD